MTSEQKQEVIKEQTLRRKIKTQLFHEIRWLREITINSLRLYSRTDSTFPTREQKEKEAQRRNLNEKKRKN